ncbi:MAG TPA: hypothetical protein VFE02_02325 [Candidatus Acidoferrales bacterium]|nr:hypothetical protein [Candidatus Acidoferrales bacterium]
MRRFTEELKKDVTLAGGEMSQTMEFFFKGEKLAIGSLLVIGLLSMGNTTAFSQDRSKPETIDATAMGTEAQMGKEFSITLTIYEYSPPADKQILTEAFQVGKDQGLYNALSKMRAVGHIAVTGTLGFDVSYIQMTPTPSGRTIRFVTNRLLRFGEVYRDNLSTSYNLTAGEFDLDDENKSKSKGSFYPEAALAFNKQGELQYNLIGFPWQLVDVIDWKGTSGVN